MESIVAAVCLGGGLVAMVITLVLTMRLQAKTPRIKEEELRPTDPSDR